MSAGWFITNETAPVTRGKQTFVVENTHAKKNKKTLTSRFFAGWQGNAQRDQIILHLIHMHVSVKVLRFVYLHCVGLVNTAERKGNRKHNSASKICAIWSIFTFHYCSSRPRVCLDLVDCTSCQVQQGSARDIRQHPVKAPSSAVQGGTNELSSSLGSITGN